MRRAVGLARPDGIILPFVECAAHLLPIFAEMPESERQDTFTAHLIDSCVRYAGQRKTLPDIPQLTKRETEVLTLLAQGLNRNGIAQRLIVSPATVKAHSQRTPG